jgi:hypothetical protein
MNREMRKRRQRKATGPKHGVGRERPFGLESDPWVAPAHRRTNSAVCFGPVATGREKRKELEERKEKASAKDF